MDGRTLLVGQLQILSDLRKNQRCRPFTLQQHLLQQRLLLGSQHLLDRVFRLPPLEVTASDSIDLVLLFWRKLQMLLDD